MLRIFTFEDCSGTLPLTDEEYHQALLSIGEEYPQEEEDKEEGALHVRALRDYLVRRDYWLEKPLLKRADLSSVSFISQWLFC